MPSAAQTPDTIDTLLDQGDLALSQGQLDQARAHYEAVLALDPEQFDAWHLLGVVAMQAGQLDEAIRRFDKAVAIAPDEAMAHTNLGLAWVLSQNNAKALPCFNQALALEPGFAEAHLGRGRCLADQQQWQEAADNLAQALAGLPTNPEAHFQMGRACLALGRHPEVVTHNQQVLATLPQHTAARVNLGHAQLALRQFKEAAQSYEQALAQDPSMASALTRLGEAHLALSQPEQALACYERALALQPRQADVLGALGTGLYRLGRVADATRCFKETLAQVPDDVATLSNLGGALRDSGQLDEALRCCTRAAELEPGHFGAQMNLANVLYDLGQWQQAGQAYARVNAIQPQHADSLWGQGWCDLVQGNWERGFPLLEWRWKKASMAAAWRPFIQPLWLGQGDLRGRTLLLHAEQGLGDTIQFSRYASMAAAQGAKVILEVQPPLKRLMGSLAGPAMVVARGEDKLPPYDLHCPLMSLPLAFKTTLSSIQTPQSYLSADPQLVDIWAARLGPKTRPRIGIVWSGNAQHVNDNNRSMPLATLLSGLPDGVQLFCLQKDIRDSDAEVLRHNAAVTVLPEALETFEDTAALIAHMDMVVTVDTSIAHLAGALGKPTWVLLSRHHDWRWLLERQDSPWYASMRLLRQTTPGQWAQPLQELRTLVAHMLAPQGSSTHLH